MIIFSFILYLVRSVRLLFFSLYLYDLKEYRFDRMLVHLKTATGQRLIYNPLSISKWLILFCLIFNLLPSTLLLTILTLVFALESLFFINGLLKKSVIIPQAKKRNLGIIIFVISVEAGLIYLLKVDLLSLLIFDRSFPLIVALGVVFSNFVFHFYKLRIIKRAGLKIQKYPQLKVIGITGSYGKTSTKNFLKTILSQKFNVSTTNRSINTPIGISEHILKNINKNTQVFIVEMAAYKIGEIGEIARFVKPSIAIITAIGNQHLSLFGTLASLKKAKFELIDHLTNKGLVILNMDNTPFEEYKKEAENIGKRVVLIGKKIEADFRAVDIEETKFNLSFSCLIKSKKERFDVSLLGKQNIGNLLLAIYSALEMGLTVAEIRQGLKQIRPSRQTMNPLKTRSGAILIDDTFNTNPQAVLAALGYLKLYKGKKIMVLQPLIELGAQAGSSHILLGKEAVTVCDRVFLTNRNYYNSFLTGLTVDEKKKVEVLKSTAVIGKLNKLLKADDVCLFEGKEAEKILKGLNL